MVAGKATACALRMPNRDIFVAWASPADFWAALHRTMAISKAGLEAAPVMCFVSFTIEMIDLLYHQLLLFLLPSFLVLVSTTGTQHEGGGGGGYSGGAGGYHTYGGGGGGGSYVHASALHANIAQGGNNFAEGFVVIDDVSDAADELLITPLGAAGRFGPDNTQGARHYGSLSNPLLKFLGINSGIQVSFEE